MSTTRTRIAPILALVLGVLGLAIGELVKLLDGNVGPLLSSGLTVAGGTLPLIIDYVKERGDQADDPRPRPPAYHQGYPGQQWPQHTQYPYQYPRYPQYRKPPPRRNRSAGWLLVILLAVLVVGGGAAYGISYGISYATGKETVRAERLLAPASGRGAGVTVTVEKVDTTDHYTKVKITATNKNQDSVTLPLFGNCQLIDGAGASLKPGYPFGGLDPITVPPNGTSITETITFSGTPPPAATTATLAFDTVFGTLSAERSLQVNGIKLKAA